MKPANFILDLLRTYERRGTSARNIMASGRFFDFSDNLIRVTLSRLVARGIIENFERGRYRLTKQSDPVNDFVEGWRDGEERRKPWTEHRFLMVHLSTVTDRDAWVLDSLGFRQLKDSIWARPDNLARSHEALVTLMKQLGSSNDLLLGSSVHLSSNDEDTLMSCYDTDALTERYCELTVKLNESERRLKDMPRVDALKESFMLGGEAIQALAKDPLLPDEVQPYARRFELWKTMLRYDKTGRDIWSEPETEPNVMPASMASYA